MRRLKINPKITNKDSVSLEKYLQDVSREDMINIEEETELAQRIRNGDAEALSKLVRANLRFVVSVAKQYQNSGLPLPDLINEGNLGLIKAAQRFDETKGFKFISYAVWWIRQSIMQALANQGRLVRLPVNKSVIANKISRASSRLEQELEREPSAEEIADAVESTPELAKDLMRASNQPVSMDASFSDDDFTMYDTLRNDREKQPDEDLINNSLHDELMRILSQLDERESTILQYYFGLHGEKPLTLEEIGKKVNLTKERVRQIKDRSLRRLKIKSKQELLRIYFS
ncbi:MAG: RNA polymerase sigma factor RpoD/SigA [Mangrovibacterium sp.]